MMNNMKLLAINLPAFHRIPENDEWWGEGFTEWDNVRGGKSFFEGHYQPIEPLNDYYYDLSKIEDIEQQMILAKDNNIYGFIYYHYWFGNGRILFEKPLELIRTQVSLDFHYCLCWSNTTWLTTWHGLEPRELLKQEYPGTNDWKMHIDYFISFFRDKKYIKVDNKPMLYIYNASEIPDYDKMIVFWENECRNAGFDGIYVVEYISSKNKSLCSTYSSAVVEFEPQYTAFFDIGSLKLFKRFLCKKFKRLDIQDYDFLWSKIIKRKRTYQGKPIIKGCFSGWDNSARKGIESMVVKGRTPESFERNFNRFINWDRQDASKEYCVINAWNEWSEGAYLEPDKKDGYKYLEVIRRVLSDKDE